MKFVDEVSIHVKAGDGGNGLMSFRRENGFGTSSASLLALPSVKRAFATPPARPIWLFAAGAPESAPFAPVNLG